MKYNPRIVIAFFAEHGIPEPLTEYKFHPSRKWLMDFCWRENPFDSRRWVCLEVQGGIFIQGRHSRGAALLKEYEKLNTAAAIGFRILYVTPNQLCTKETADLIKKCLGV